MDSSIYVYYTPLEKYNVITLYLNKYDRVTYVGDGSFPYPLTMECLSQQEFYTNYRNYTHHVCFFDFTPTKQNLEFISMIQQSHIFGTNLTQKTKLPVLKTKDIICKMPSYSSELIECDICYHYKNKYHIPCCSLIICIDCIEKSKDQCPQCRRYFSFDINYVSNKTYPDYLYFGTLIFNRPSDYTKMKSQIDYFYPSAKLTFSHTII